MSTKYIILQRDWNRYRILEHACRKALALLENRPDLGQDPVAFYTWQRALFDACYDMVRAITGQYLER